MPIESVPSLDQQIACVARELRLREVNYPRWVAAGKMKQATADKELAAMRGVMATVEAVKDLKAALQAMVDDAWNVAENSLSQHDEKLDVIFNERIWEEEDPDGYLFWKQGRDALGRAAEMPANRLTGKS